ncbi:MAG: hypothetical protein ABJA18_06860 [bacterium]
MRFVSSIRVVRVSLALAVGLWMAGAGCMLGCENLMTAAASNEVASSTSSSIIVAAGGACASMHSDDSCPKHRAHSVAKTTAHSNSITTSANAPELAATPGTMMDCPLAVNATAALTKVGSDQTSIALPSSSERSPLANSPEQTSAFTRPLRLPNRGHTYLRCCTFLI